MTFPKDEDAAYVSVIERGIIGHPRSQQTRIGPSGLGDPCDRSLVYGLAGVRPERHPYSGWKPTVGTASHTWLEDRFGEENSRLGYRRWLTERRVIVGEILDEPVPGSMDLFDLFESAVIDHKLVGPSMLKKYRSNGPGEKYRVQAHLYGAGMARLDLPPKEVRIAFLPRDGELSSLYVWREPWDPDVAAEALTRANRLALTLRDEHNGDPAAMTADMPHCEEMWCDWCREGRRYIPAGGSMFDVLK